MLETGGILSVLFFHIPRHPLQQESARGIVAAGVRLVIETRPPDCSVFGLQISRQDEYTRFSSEDPTQLYYIAFF